MANGIETVEVIENGKLKSKMVDGIEQIGQKKVPIEAKRKKHKVCMGCEAPANRGA